MKHLQLWYKVEECGDQLSAFNAKSDEQLDQQCGTTMPIRKLAFTLTSIFPHALSTVYIYIKQCILTLRTVSLCCNKSRTGTV